MSKLRGIARFAFHENAVEEFKRLSEQCIALVREREPGTLQYDIYFNDDETAAVVYEEYVDSQALLDHFANIGELMGPIMGLATVTGELLGEPNAELRAMIEANDEPRLLHPYLSLHPA